MSPIDRLREICLALPEAVEIETWEQPTFRVNNKMFAISSPDAADSHHVTMKAPPGEQALLLASGGRFFRPSYVGDKGWIGVNLDASTDWSEIGELVEDSYRMTALKRQIAALDAQT